MQKAEELKHKFSKDIYDMEFGKIRGTTYKIINTINDIYFDKLQSIFTSETGLNTYL